MDRSRGLRSSVHTHEFSVQSRVPRPRANRRIDTNQSSLTPLGHPLSWGGFLGDAAGERSPPRLEPSTRSSRSLSAASSAPLAGIGVEDADAALPFQPSPRPVTAGFVIRGGFNSSGRSPLHHP